MNKTGQSPNENEYRTLNTMEDFMTEFSMVDKSNFIK